VAVAALLVAGLFSVATVQQVSVWTNDLELWRHAIERAPLDHPLPHAHLGYAYASRAQPERAVAAYRRALEIETQYPVPKRAPSARIRANLALALSEMDESEEAQQLMREVVSGQPGFASHHLQLAAIQSRALQFEAAEASLLHVLELVPNQPLAESLLGLVRETRSRFEALPAEEPGEPLPLVAERAAVMAMAGRIRDADALWEVVVEDPDAPLPLLYKAAAHFALVGYQPSTGRIAFRRLQDAGANPTRVARLEERLVGRQLVE
jgi:tetratricopeptide (TPR) repeat protein